MDGSGLGNLIFLALLIGVFYVFLIRPQKRRVEEQRKLIGSIEPGDEIVTVGGLYGRVTSVGDEDMQIEIAPGTKVRYAKAAIARRVTEGLAGTKTQAFEPAAKASDDNDSDGAEAKATSPSTTSTAPASASKKTAARKTPAKKATAKSTSAKTTSAKTTARKSSSSPSSRSNKRTR